MLYSEETREITVAVEEMVSFSLFHYLGTAAGEELLPVKRTDASIRRRLGLPEETLPLERVFFSGDHTFRLAAAADGLVREGRERTLLLSFAIGEDPASPSEATLRAARGIAFLLAAAH